MKIREELQDLFQFARENDLPWIEVDGVKMPVPQTKAAPINPESDVNSPKIPSDPAAEYTDEEILFYSTPYFDQLQAEKEEKRKHLEEEAKVRTTNG